MSSNWGSKLEKKLGNLTDKASKESIQTLAKWIGFNRKHAPVIAGVVGDELSKSATETRQWLYWQLIHEVLILDSGTSKWEKNNDLRLALGETSILPFASQQKAKPLALKIEPFIKQWDENNAFGGPTLITQIRTQLSKESAAATSAGPTPTSSPAKRSPTKPASSTPKVAAPAVEVEVEATKVSEEKLAERSKESAKLDAVKPTATLPELDQRATKKADKRASLSMIPKVEYDFEATGIAYGKVDAQEFLDPCKAIATLQIARDLRNDTAVQLSSLLANVPKELTDHLTQMKEKGEPATLTEDQARQFSVEIKEELLDMDINEELQNVRTFRDIVRRQVEARKQLIYLLIRSRCQFGSDESAEKYYKLDDTIPKLRKRKGLVFDAMELEGLDFEAKQAEKSEVKEPELPDLTWYKINSDGENKRQRTES